MKKPEQYYWRGLMIDTVRHMPSIEYLYNLVDRMASLGLNRLHLHLSDDQGFRIEIKKYPKLHTVGGFRTETVVDKSFPTPWSPMTPYQGDATLYGGYYTQQELKDLVSYAKSKGVEIIPEIDIPGHVTAILTAYPEFSAGTPPVAVATYWGIFENVLSDSAQTIVFLKNMFDEIIEIFDSEYIHIGGDEVLLTHYDNDHSVPKKILKEIIIYLQSKNKQVIMWDDAADLALETDSIIMNWQDISIGIKQLEKKGRVIFCPNEFFYFDYYQGDPNIEPLAIGGYLPKEKVAQFSIKPEIWEQYGLYIVGIQANIWTEYMPTEQQMDYMLYPRIEVFAKLRP